MNKAEVIAHFDGSPTKVARALGLKSRQAIHAWPEEVPELYQYKLNHITGGALELSPELEAKRGAPEQGRAAA